jgi:AraC family transcriptional regulator
MADSHEFHLAQRDGRPPETLAAGSAPGESGVSIVRARFKAGAQLIATPPGHLICFQETQQARFECRIAERRLAHEPPRGSLAVCPAGVDCEAEAKAAGAVDMLLVTVDPGQLALAAAEDLSLDAQVREQLVGYDTTLLSLARTLARESAGGYPNGPLFWNETAGAFIDGLVAGHTSESERRARGSLSNDMLRRVRDYVVAHLDEPIEVATLASLVGRSPFHFTRLFRRSVGLSPHRYVVHLRLQRAMGLVREGGCGLAEIAVRTGFADQSHLSRWVRRVHGVSPAQLAA